MKAEHEKLMYWLKGDVSAVAMIELLAYVAQAWDDLVDGDRYVQTDRISKAFIMCLIELPRNAFYTRHFSELQPMIEQSIYDWLNANVMESAGGQWSMIAYVLRDRLTSIVLRAAWIIGGEDWMRSISFDVYRHAYDETPQAYLESLGDPVKEV